MKIEWYRSATVGIFTKSGTSILCDPWITNGAFIGSWYHWPPLKGFEHNYLVDKKWDGIYVSHFHADHFDRKFLAAIIRAQRELKVLIPNYSNKWLKRAILNLGLKTNQLIEVESNKSINFRDIKITMYAADYCNPHICGSSITCNLTPRKLTSNDSVALFEADGNAILNANDALAVQSAQKLWPLLKNVDLLLGHYGGAGPYPQCFTDFNQQQKLEKAKELGWTFVNRLISTAEKLKAKYVFPYAGQYVLGGDLSNLNRFRSVVPLNNVIDYIEESGVTIPVSLEPFGEFDLSKEEISNEWKEPSKDIYDKYVHDISKDRFPYQNREEFWSNGQEILNKALNNVKKEFDYFVSKGGKGSSSSITITTENLTGTINFGERFSAITQTPIYENHTKIEVDEILLKRLIIRKPNYQGFTQYHFNQAEIGSHLKWSRNGPYPKETSFINYMQSSLYQNY